MSGVTCTKNGHGHGCVTYRPMPTLRHRFPAIFDRTWSAISRAKKAFDEGVAKTRRMARAYEELAAMSDPELHDIGISRADIPAVVSGTYRRTRHPIYDPASSGQRGRRQSIAEGKITANCLP